MPEQPSTTLPDKLMFDFTRFYVLVILYEGPIHGYGIMRKFKERTGKEISASLIYPFLHQLEARELVEQKIEFVGSKEKKIFELTPKGREFCENLFERFSEIISSAIEPSLETCASCGAKIYEGGHEEDVNGKKMSFCCVHCAKSYLRLIGSK